MSSIRKSTGFKTFGLVAAGALALSAVGCGGTDGDEPEAGVGKTYILKIPTDNWSPAAVGSELGAFVPPFLFKVESLADGEGTLLIGTAEGSSQQSCNPTALVDATGASVPEMKSGPDDVPIYIVNSGTAEQPVDPPVRVLSTIYDFKMDGVLPDGSGSGEGTLTVTMDVREIYSLFTQILGVSPDTVCSALDSLDTACQPCRDGELYCLTLTASYLEAEEFSGDMSAIASAPSSCLD